MQTQVTPYQLWNFYTRHNARKWLGFWVMWDPDTRKLLQSFECIRHVAVSEDGTTIRHQNTNIYSDGRVVNTGRRNGPWEYSRETNCDEKGLIHPGSSEGARALFFENGGGTWTVLNPARGSVFFIEIFFPHGDLRFSAGMAYKENGELFRLTLIREDLTSQVSDYWSRGTELSPTGAACTGDVFTGVERILTEELKIAAGVESDWNQNYWLEDDDKREGNTVYNLPDHIKVACPKRLFSHDNPGDSKGARFHISICGIFKNKDNKELWEQTAFYDDGKFSHFKQGIYFTTV